MEKVLIVGASGHGKVVAEAIELNGEYTIHGFIDSFKPVGEKVLDYEILGTEDLISQLYDQGVTRGIIAIGDNWTRFLLAEKIKRLVPGFEFITVIHPSVIISKTVTVGKGSVILASATLNAESKVGDFCILNTGVNFGHESEINDYSSLAPGVTVGGNVIIDTFSAICLGANIIHSIYIGMHSIVGAGALVNKDVENFRLAYGVPAKEIKEISVGEKYLSGKWKKQKVSL